MKKFFALAALAVLFAGCGKDDDNTTPAPDPNAIPKDNVRVVATLPTTGIQASDKFVLAGSFKTNAWTPASSTYSLTKQSDGTYRVDVPISAFEDTKDLEYKVVRNPTADAADAWKFVEKDATCGELAANRILKRADANKSVTIKIDNFRNTATCPN
jgi:hypothetical protein